MSRVSELYYWLLQLATSLATETVQIVQNVQTVQVVEKHAVGSKSFEQYISKIVQKLASFSCISELAANQFSVPEQKVVF
jgi:hypothetical protein